MHSLIHSTLHFYLINNCSGSSGHIIPQWGGGSSCSGGELGTTHGISNPVIIVNHNLICSFSQLILF